MSAIDAAIQKMAEHTRENPTHGMNCACKDNVVGEARRSLRGAVEWDNFMLLAAYIQRGHVPDGVLRDRGIKIG